MLDLSLHFLRLTAELELRQGHGDEARRIACYLLAQPRNTEIQPDPFAMLQATMSAQPEGSPPPEIVPQEVPWEAGAPVVPAQTRWPSG